MKAAPHHREHEHSGKPAPAAAPAAPAQHNRDYMIDPFATKK